MILLLNIDQDDHCEKPLFKELVELSIDNSIEIISSIFDLNNINNGKFFLNFLSKIDYGVGALNIALQSVTWRGSTLKSKSVPKNDLILSNPFVDREAISNKLIAGNNNNNFLNSDNGKVIDEAKNEDTVNEKIVKKEDEEIESSDGKNEKKSIILLVFKFNKPFVINY